MAYLDHSSSIVANEWLNILCVCHLLLPAIPSSDHQQKRNRFILSSKAKTSKSCNKDNEKQTAALQINISHHAHVINLLIPCLIPQAPKFANLTTEHWSKKKKIMKWQTNRRVSVS